MCTLLPTSRRVPRPSSPHIAHIAASAAAIVPHMDLFLVRHADAVSGRGIPDALRGLTAAGRRDARALGASLAVAGARPDAIVCSPLVRAIETGTHLADAMSFEGAIEN